MRTGVAFSEVPFFSGPFISYDLEFSVRTLVTEPSLNLAFGVVGFWDGGGDDRFVLTKFLASL